MVSSSKDKAEAALRKEGVRLEEDFTRLSKAKTVAEKKEAFWGQETHRLGRQVVRTRATLDDQLKLEVGRGRRWRGRRGS
jgi:hypothetical protein